MFDHDDNNMPRTWKSKTAKEARSRSVTAECVKMLAATAAVRLEHQPDNIENILLGAMTGDALSLHMNILDSNTWDQVAPVNTLISPVQCKDILSQFKEETELIMMARKYDSIQVIDGDGGFNATGLDHFMKTTKMAECGESYVVVSIMGPQSGGKSTLLNNLFITNFMEMNASKGRSQTTKGIWLAKCAGIEPFTVVMDLEGTDGSEREDDTTFEKQSALFALAVSDILLINMWCHDIGREQAANKPLLKAVFQAMMRLFTQRKTTLLFVIRDKSKTPLRKLEDALKKDIRKIWNNVPKPQAHRETHFSVFFNVEVVALTNYETKQEIFMEQVAILRRRFHHSTSPGRLAGDRRGVVPASGFALSTQQIWKTIKENKDLDLPKHKVMVATVRCEEIANEIHSSMTTDMEWCEIKRAVEHQMVPGFGKKLSAILDKFLSRYDTETNYFDEGVKTSKRKQLVSKLIQTVFPALQSMERHILSKTLDDFKAAFDEALVIRKERFADATLEYTQTFLGEFDKWVREDAAIKHAHWDLSKVRDKLRCDIDSHVDSVRVTKLNELTNNHKVHLNALAEPVGAFLHEANACTWQEIGGHFRKMILTCKYYLSSELSEFDLDQPTMNEKIEELEEHAKRVVISEAASVASNALVLMKDRFETIFLLDEHHQRRDWKRMRDIRRIAPVALSESRKLLAVLAAVRLDDRTDNIENLLSHALANDAVYRVYLNSNTWDQVTFTIITPIECTSLLSQLENKTKYILLEAEQAVKEWKKHKRLKIIRRIISTGSAILAVHSNPFLFPLIIPALLS